LTSEKGKQMGFIHDKKIVRSLWQGANAFFFLVEFATLKVVDNAVKYNLYKPAEIDSLLKQLDVGASTEEQS
jgi:hypothetical protein